MLFSLASIMLSKFSSMLSPSGCDVVTWFAWCYCGCGRSWNSIYHGTSRRTVVAGNHSRIDGTGPSDQAVLGTVRELSMLQLGLALVYQIVQRFLYFVLSRFLGGEDLVLSACATFAIILPCWIYLPLEIM